MEKVGNVTEFILFGLSYDQNIQIFCFIFFLFCYISLLVGNLLILISICSSHLFHQPMYYFLSHLSTMDIYYTSSVTPKLIGDLLTERKTISYGYCMFQIFSVHFFGSIEVFILTAMAFDRYVAICKPLHYMVIMSRKKCNLLVLAAWAGGAAHSFPQLSMTLKLPCCGPNEIDHYFCDIFPLLKIACTDTYTIGLLVVTNSGIIVLVIFIILFVSYAIILWTLRTHSAEGRRKALSTCGSHFTVVVLFFIPAIFSYLRPPTTYTEDKVFALFYTIIAPLLNPIIYTLRNTEMKNAMRKVWCQKIWGKGNLSELH
ncbi:olfactory receptor 4P4-like [Trichosurus vulpecula]|uniref:olfactory receptor 4P4-like n=1 Tax=Trichosurus vulpecula TaxID=9337 RepID=UPI00186B4FD9|nr:olfactory receptor 4P4-like [Trichosurus vulpecula]